MAAFVTDNFTDPNGTSLLAHVPDSGGAWARHPSWTTAAFSITGNRIYQSVGGGNVYIAPGTPPSADQAVSGTVRVVTPAAGSMGFFTRLHAATNQEWYWGRMKDNAVELYHGSTLLATVAQTFAAAADYALLQTSDGHATRVFVDGVCKLAAVHTGLTATNRVGAGSIQVAADSAAAGYHLDSFSGDTLAADRPRLILGGDSLSTPVVTASYLTRHEFGWPSVVSKTYTGWNVQQTAVSGRTSQGVLDGLASEVYPLLDGNRVEAGLVYVLMIGTNDLYNGVAVATIQANIRDICRAVASRGAMVMVGTVIPLDKTGQPAGTDTNRQTLNTWLRDNWPTFAHGLWDPCAATAFDALADASNATNYGPDKVHLTDAGNAALAATFGTPFGATWLKRGLKALDRRNRLPRALGRGLCRGLA